VRVAVGLSLAIFFASSSARADDAESIIAHGVELREQGHDDQALLEFRRAFAMTPSPRARAQMALAEQALGLWVSAEIDLLEATRGADPWIAKNRGALTQSLAVIQQHLGSLEIRGGSAGGEVFVDGASVGALPMTSGRRVEAGTRNVEVRAKGYYTASRVVTVPPAGIARETIELRPQLASESGTSTTPGAIGAAPPKDTETKSTSNVQRTLGWVFLGAGAALAITGVVGQLLRQSAISAYNADRSCPGLGTPTQPPGCTGNVSAASTWQTVSIVGFAAGGALSVSGVVLVVTAPTHRGDAATIGWVGTF
jgi:hypothetical protein